MSNQQPIFSRIPILIFVVVFISACASSPKKEEKEFGASVRNMVKAQIYDRSTIKNPSSDVIQGMDSTKAISDLRKVYRSSEGNKQQLKQLDLHNIE